MFVFNGNIGKIKLNSNNISTAKLNGNILFGNELPLYKFGLLSDTHVSGDTEDICNTVAKFKNAIDYFDKNCSFIVISGDISYDGRERDFIKYKELKDSIDIPIKTCSGNHDAYGIEYYKSYTNDAIYYEYLYKNDVFLFLGADGSFNYDKPLTDEAMEWFKNKVKEHANKRIFVIFHFFMTPPGNANNLAKTDIFNHNSAQYKEIDTILKENKNIIFCAGHSHLEFAMERYDKNANFVQKGETCDKIHTPSLGYPKTNDTGISNSDTYNLEDVGFGYIVEVYSNYVIFKGIKFTKTSQSILSNYTYKI